MPLTPTVWIAEAVERKDTSGRHRSISGHAPRAAVLGANDGPVSNLSIIFSVAGSGLVLFVLAPP